MFSGQDLASGAETGMDARIQELFERCPALCGFSVRDPADLPDSCTRSGNGSDLFVTDIGISPRLGADQYGEIFNEIFSTLSEVLAEEPDAGERLRGRTFARTLH
jgi:hypothetical protein